MFYPLNNYTWPKFLKICNHYLSIFSLTQNYSQSIFSPVSCRTYPLSTLMWKENPENGTSLIRQLEHVGWVEVNGRFQFDYKLYPNVEFGFNKRNFLVTTTWVCNLLVTVLYDFVLQVPYNNTFVRLSVCSFVHLTDFIYPEHICSLHLVNLGYNNYGSRMLSEDQNFWGKILQIIFLPLWIQSRFGLYPLNANVEKVFSNKEPSFFCLTAYPFSFKQLRLFSSEHMSLGRANTVIFNDVSRSNINVENNPFEIIVW